MNFLVFFNDMQSSFSFADFENLIGKKDVKIPIFPYKNEYDDSKIEPDYTKILGNLGVNALILT